MTTTIASRRCSAPRAPLTSASLVPPRSAFRLNSRIFLVLICFSFSAVLLLRVQCIVKNGKVFCVGYNGYGELGNLPLGDEDYFNSVDLVQVQNLDHITEISCGDVSVIVRFTMLLSQPLLCCSVRATSAR